MREILKWKRNDILNDDLLQHQLKPLPRTYQSTPDWYNSFHSFLVEEMRCALKSVMRKNFEELDSFEIAKFGVPHHVDDDVCESLMRFSVDDEQQRKKLDNVVCSIALLVKITPHQQTEQTITLESALQGTQHAVLGIGFPADEKAQAIPLDYKVKFTQSFEAEVRSFDCKEWRAILLHTNTWSSVRIADALVSNRSPYFMTDILSGSRSFDRSCGEKLASCELLEPFTQHLNESQKLVVEQVMTVGTDGVSPIQIVKGPPG